MSAPACQHCGRELRWSARRETYLHAWNFALRCGGQRTTIAMPPPSHDPDRFNDEGCTPGG
jgi:hypothetical protein